MKDEGCGVRVVGDGVRVTGFVWASQVRYSCRCQRFASRFLPLTSSCHDGMLE